MKENLKKRTFTSILLLLLLFFSFINNYLLGYVLIIFAIFSGEDKKAPLAEILLTGKIPFKEILIQKQECTMCTVRFSCFCSTTLAKQHETCWESNNPCSDNKSSF